MESSFYNDKEFTEKYYDLHSNTTPTKQLERVLEQFFSDKKGNAIDIGAGNLRDTKYLLEKGFEVTAVDPEDASRRIAEDLKNEHLTFIQEKLGAFEFPKESYDVVNAQQILFHFPKESLKEIIEKITTSLKPGGIFCADFLGLNDEWNREGSKKAFHSAEEIRDLLHDYEIEGLEEKETDAPSAWEQVQGTNKPKHWHKIRVTARKK